jgi:hypothetical protein
MDQRWRWANMVVDSQGEREHLSGAAAVMLISFLGQVNPVIFYCSKLDLVAPLLPSLLSLTNKRAQCYGLPNKDTRPMGGVEFCGRSRSDIVLSSSHTHLHPLFLCTVPGFTRAP